MKVALLASEIAPGSAPKIIGWLIRNLRKLGVEAEAIVLYDKGVDRAQFKHYYDFHLGDAKVRYVYDYVPQWLRKIQFKFPGMAFFSMYHLVGSYFAHRAVAESEFDLIIPFTQFMTLPANRILSKQHIPYILYMWDPTVFNINKIYSKRAAFWKFKLMMLFARWLDAYAVRRCLGIIIGGHFHIPEIRKLTEKPIAVHPLGCFVLKKLPPFRSRKRQMVAFDRWDYGNNPIRFLEVLKAIEPKDVCLVIGGFWHPSTFKDEFIREVERYQLIKRVTLMGPLDEQMIMTLCSESWVHVHTIFDGFGMATVEAAACGCIPIIPVGSGSAELFTHRESAMMPEPDNIAQVAECANYIFANPARADKMSKAAWAVAKKNTWMDSAKKLKQIIFQMTNHELPKARNKK